MHRGLQWRPAAGLYNGGLHERNDTTSQNFKIKVSRYCLGFHSPAPANHGTQLLDKHISYRIRRQLYVRVAKFSLLFSYCLPLWHSALGKQILKCQLGEKFKCGWLKLLKEKRKASECRVQFQN